MRVLLDTHVWLWAAGSPERLSTPVREILADPSTERFLSTVSVWEFLLLARKGRLGVKEDPVAMAKEMLQLQGMSVLPVTLDIAFDTNALEGFDRQDPGDRFIVATARVHQLILLTADHWIRGWSGVNSVW